MTRCLTIILLLVTATTPAATNWIVFVGNSIGRAPALDTSYCQQTLTNLGSGWGMTNICFSGYTSQLLEFEQLVNIHAASRPVEVLNLAHVLEGGNSLLFSNAANAAALAQIAFSDLTNLCGRIGTNGQSVHVGTVPNRTDLLSDSVKGPALTNLNNLIISNWQNFASGVIRYHTNALLDYVTTPANYSDNIHPALGGSTAYSVQMADYFRTLVEPPRSHKIAGKTTHGGKVELQ